MSFRRLLKVLLSLTFLKTGTTSKIFNQLGKWDPFKQHWKNQLNVWKFRHTVLRTTTRIQLRPGVSEESRTIMIIIILWVSGLLCSLILAERIAGRDLTKSSRSELSGEKNSKQLRLINRIWQEVSATKKRRYSK